ncbi:MAG: UvrD-helicase domain-containing protein, partial [Oscillospiraceae bacterium]|nr:UvrD-helicase domain-containing protein [Candidatus Equicaccousia limihippi]
MNKTPLENQISAINAKGSTLVSASAGSGKTYVLVERVLKIIMDEENKISADKLLIATFTDAAANELKSRIALKLSEAIAENPDNRYLHEQKRKFALATVSTIDSFCLKLVKSHFQDLSLPDNLNIATKANVTLCKEEAFFETVNRRFEEDKDNFNAFLQSTYISGKDSMSSAKEFINKLYDFSCTLSRPEEFLKRGVATIYNDTEKFNKTFKLYCGELCEKLKKLSDDFEKKKNKLPPDT